MKLLITTQAVDLDDPVLSFFHRWVEEFAKNVEHVHVICLKEGRRSLPKNVSVHSLGKEGGRSRMKYIYRLYKYVWGLRREYDVVFVHMNPEYLVAVGWLWKFLRKKTALWYIHPRSSWRLQLGQPFADKIFSATPDSFPLKSKKLLPVGHGIDTDFFMPGKHENKGAFNAMCAARIAPVKNIETIIGAVEEMFKRGKQIAFDLYGEELPRDEIYANELKKRVGKVLGHVEVVNFKGRTTQENMRIAYQTHDVHVNATNSGSYDKAVFESMACGTITVVSNSALEDVIPDALMFKEKDPISLADTLERVMSMSHDERKRIRENLRKVAVERYSLTTLVKKIVAQLV